MALTESRIKTAEPASKLYTMWDEHGLHLEVPPNGQKRWRVKYRINGKDARQSLGIWPYVTLLEARQRRDEVKRLVAQGIDPAEKRRQDRGEQARIASLTVMSVGEDWLKVWKEDKSTVTVDRVKGLLNNHVYPVIGDMPVANITAKKLLDEVIRPIEAQGLRETAHQVKRRMGQLLRFGAVSTETGTDVTPNLRGMLKPVRVTHHAALTDPVRLRPLVNAVWDSRSNRAHMRDAMKLLAYTFPRPGMLRHMEWSEISFDEQLWSIPAEKMKMRVAHIIPLSTQALFVLGDIRKDNGCFRWVFPNEKGCDQPLSSASLNNAHKRIGYGTGIHVPHGWRATARTILAERLGYGRVTEWIELQLAHEVVDPNGRAYNRTAFMDERRVMMQTWADYLDSLRAASPTNA